MHKYTTSLWFSSFYSVTDAIPAFCFLIFALSYFNPDTFVYLSFSSICSSATCAFLCSYRKSLITTRSQSVFFTCEKTSCSISSGCNKALFHISYVLPSYHNSQSFPYSLDALPWQYSQLPPTSYTISQYPLSIFRPPWTVFCSYPFISYPPQVNHVLNTHGSHISLVWLR